MPAKSKGSKELHSVDADGKRTDAHLHEPILAQGDNDAAKNIGKEQARKAGLTEVEIMKLYAD